ncbi:hypothetical protein AGDE_13392 [Angomonas deanei]|nr:hypothetical protein AGDE_13392 [Angomonas deanei]|eukprot:EPY22419.1 hypothetical protein AGDE_13392 [Angomonas deanei]
MRTAIPSQPSIPIVVSGLPSVLYAHPSFARRDVEGQRRRNALLQHIQEVQFDEKRDPTPTTGGRASTPEERWMRQWRRAVVRSDDTTESVVDWLRRWKFTQVLPLLSFSTNLVYGGPSPTGDRQQPRRTLRYYVGSASEADSRTGEVKNVWTPMPPS